MSTNNKQTTNLNTNAPTPPPSSTSPATSPSPTPATDDKSKARREWIQVWVAIIATIFIPAAIGISGWFQSQSSATSSAQQHDTDLKIASDQQHEAALQTYLDRMTDLLFNDHLATADRTNPDDEIRSVARARTLTILSQLKGDGNRKAKVLQFLHEAQLITYVVGSPTAPLAIIDMNGADLSGADLFDADLSGANLRGVNVIDANLEDANLTGTNQRNAGR